MTTTKTKTIKVDRFRVDLFFRDENDPAPCGFEATHENTTNDGGFYCEGWLGIRNKMVDDYDGCFALPDCVVTALRGEGYTVPADCTLNEET